MNQEGFIKVLPINPIPLVSTYPEYGMLFSILDLTDPDVGGWITTSFLHTYCYRDGFTVFKNHFYLWQQCPFLHCFIFPREYILDITTIQDVIQYALQNDYYMLLSLDRFYIQATPEFHTRHQSHQTLIYGYSQTDQIVYSADNLANGKYTKSAYQINDVCEAFQKLFLTGYKSDTEIFLIKKIKCERYYFDFNFLIKELYLYIHPELMNIEEYYRFEDTYCYNIQGLSYLKQLLMDQPNTMNVIPFYLYYEKNKLMNYRIKYLHENGYLDEIDDLILLNQEIMNQNQIIISLVLKYKRKLEKKSLQSISTYIDKVLGLEIEFTNMLIDKLKKRKQILDKEKVLKQLLVMLKKYIITNR